MTKNNEIAANNTCVMGATRTGMSDMVGAIVLQYQSLGGKVVVMDKGSSLEGSFQIAWKKSKKGAKP
jgi:type IV secretory pathway VirB4 component